ncbi:FAD-dependent monooxygenase [Paractinoplanes toevensis]|uniref:FAD-dependent oxidoreductase n=1 Tax=Paractinoplanes toevensis TaxID=571911 RepID=A0A919W8I2_9ACTN|nr:FAD-dependent monooxygenase [Actinoplanes toevensis]GIM93996.1 FAD-dependent oxidoreductase [Actinoplanes toevensis]
MVFDVVISGAGPNGLMLACELALAGVNPLVLEQRTGPSTEQRANGMVGQVIRLLDRRGLYERLTDSPSHPAPAPQFMFAAFPLPLHELADNPVYIMMVPQVKIEAMLAARADELGVTVRHGHALSGLAQKDDRVLVDVDGPDGPYRVEARYLVGADGGRSVTRKLAGIGFPGVTTDRTVSRTAHITVPDSYRDAVTGGLRVPGYGVIPPFLHHRTESGLVAYAPFPDGRTLLSVNTHDMPVVTTDMTIAELQDALTHVLGGIEMPLGPPTGDGPHLLRRLEAGNTRLAERYRDGRVLLVGDAAHVHSAMGGPGLNLGLQDAVNLGWKLAATVRGWAPDGLLDTYETERRPAGERVTMHTLAQRALVGPGPEVTALRTLFAELLREPAVLRHIAALIAGSDITYAADPPAGRFAPDLGPVTRSGRPLLVDNTDSLADVVAPWRDRVDLVSVAVEGASALLVRPDSYVAWASAGAAPDADSLRSALTRWFGEPAAVS